MNIVPRLGLLAAVSASVAVFTAPVAFAETTVEIRENDTLGAIINDAYPGYRNRDALMQLILERNPEAFLNNNINFLVLGQTLKLPGADELGAIIQAAPPPPPAEQVVVSPVVAEVDNRLQQVVDERDQLKQQLGQLETDNKTLRDTVSRLETTGAQQSEQLRKLEEQIEALQDGVEEQVAADPRSSEVAKQLVESSEKLEQLQARYDESVKDNQGLQQQLTEQAALGNETSELKKQLAELQSGGETQKIANTELQSQLDALKQQSESLRADNEKVLAELSAVSVKLEASQSEADSLRAELNASSESNTALSSEIDQIKAAVEKDVALTPAEPSEKPGSTWWPWLLALLLLPVAWLLGQRSRPVPATAVPEIKTGVKTIEIAAAADPVVPQALTSDQLDQMAFSGAKAANKPDDPDAAIKLDMARAYLDLRNAEAANDVLKEVIQEGGSRQQQEAKEIQSFIA